MHHGDHRPNIPLQLLLPYGELAAAEEERAVDLRGMATGCGWVVSRACQSWQSCASRELQECALLQSTKELTSALNGALAGEWGLVHPRATGSRADQALVSEEAIYCSSTSI
eukprot:4710250-Amphidinium_carterae.1